MQHSTENEITEAVESEDEICEAVEATEPGTGKIPGPHARIVSVNHTKEEEGQIQLILELAFPDGSTRKVSFGRPATAPSRILQILADYCDVDLRERRFADFKMRDVPVRAVSSRDDGTRTGWELDLGYSINSLKRRRQLQKYGILTWESAPLPPKKAGGFRDVASGGNVAELKATPFGWVCLGAVVGITMMILEFLLVSSMEFPERLFSIFSIVMIIAMLSHIVVHSSTIEAEKGAPTTGDPHWEPWGSVKNINNLW